MARFTDMKKFLLAFMCINVFSVFVYVYFGVSFFLFCLSSYSQLHLLQIKIFILFSRTLTDQYYQY